MPVLQYAFQAAAQRRALYLFGVSWAHGADRVGKSQPGLQKAQIAVELHLPPIEVLPVDASELHVPVPEVALVRDVVNREQTADRIIRRYPTKVGFQVGGDKPCLPVVAVHDFSAQVEQPNGLQRRPAEEYEPLAIVFV